MIYSLARAWVERNYPNASRLLKGSLILAYGAGFDRGMAENQRTIEDVAQILGMTLPGPASEEKKK